jgi:hypothetical protein
MNDAFQVVDDGALYLDAGGIVAVQERSAPPPAGFERVPAVPTGGTIFPGLIELHNHLAYNVLQLWDVPKLYTNRNQWGGTPEYQRLISGPMKILGSAPGLMPAIVRFVECKCLAGGVTTSQGIELFSNAGARRYYRGVVRNVEQTDDPDLPEATAKISDVEAASASLFMNRLKRASCFLLHLSEGTDQKARDHFLALKIGAREWAITAALAGIHCAALEHPDFQQMASHKASMVWSPLSNLLLYGATARIKDARQAGVRMALGSDWSPTGSKNLLGELKVAWLVSQSEGEVFSQREIVAMATRNAAATLRWEKVLGSLEAGKRADLLVLDGIAGDPYDALLHATEGSLNLVMVNGVPRFGRPDLLQALGANGEAVAVGGQQRSLFLTQETEDPITAALTYAEARDRLAKALQDLPQLAKTPRLALAGPEPGANGQPSWYLALDELEPTGMEIRPRLALPGGGESGPALPPIDLLTLAAQLTPLDLDQLTVLDDHAYLDKIGRQKNLPAAITKGLPELYGVVAAR